MFKACNAMMMIAWQQACAGFQYSGHREIRSLRAGHSVENTDDVTLAQRKYQRVSTGDSFEIYSNFLHAMQIEMSQE